MKNILIIQGHTDNSSLVHSLAMAYRDSYEEKGYTISLIDLADIGFDPVLKKGYKEIQPLEDSLVNAQALIKEADHIGIFYPTWWGTMPAKLKGFFDRVFLPGFAFEFNNDSKFPKKLLDGKTCTIVTTLDTPVWYYKYIQRNLGIRTLKNLILGFCGIKTKKTVYVGPVKDLNKKDVEKWLDKIKSIDKF